MKDIQTHQNVEFTYDSQKRKPPAVEEFLDAIKYRDLIYQLIRRDIIARYKRSALGVLWTMLQPLGMMIVMAVVFSALFRQVDGYVAYVLSGLIAWTFFAQTTSAAIFQIVWGGVLLRRIYIPMTSFSISSIGTGMVNLVLSLLPLLIIVWAVKRPITWAILFLPVSILLLTAFALGMSLILSTMSIYFPDVKEMYQIIIQAWMYLTPIVYPADIIPEAYQFWFLHLNPMYYMVSMFRFPIYNGTLPPPDIMIPGALISLATLLGGWIYFAVKSDEFAYKI
jgi:ABC-type polysaccharide/polyol phosphate export permease